MKDIVCIINIYEKCLCLFEVNDLTLIALCCDMWYLIYACFQKFKSFHKITYVQFTQQKYFLVINLVNFGIVKKANNPRRRKIQ